MLRFRTVPVVKNVMDKEGEHQKFPSIIFRLTAEEFRRANPLVFQYLRV